VRERLSFESELVQLGLRRPRGWIGLHPRHRPSRGVGAGLQREYQVASEPPRLSKGALGKEFAEVQASLGVPDEAVSRLISIVSFRYLTRAIDKSYVALSTLLPLPDGAQVDAAGKIVKPKEYKGRRILTIWGSGTSNVNEFIRARTVDNLGLADIARIPTPERGITGHADLLSVADWQRQITWMVAQIAAELRVIKPIAPARADIVLKKKIAQSVEAIRAARVSYDDVGREMFEKWKDDRPVVGVAWEKAELTSLTEIGFYPADLLFNGSYMLTNLERCVLMHRMEAARRKERLDEKQIDALKSRLDSIPLGDEAELAKRLQSPSPVMVDATKSPPEVIESEFASLYFGRRVMSQRWRLLNPWGKNWRSDTDVKTRRQEHADAFMKGIVTYRYD
jgi:hypothetical protein